MTARILIVDDEPNIRLTFRTALEISGCTVREASSTDEASAAFAAEKFELVILDLRLGEGSGLNVLARMRSDMVMTPCVIVTAYGNVRNAVDAMKLGAIDFLEKPIEPNALREMVADVLARHHPRLDAEEPATFAELVNEAKRLINIREFSAAENRLAAALKLTGRSPDAHNLYGVLHEMRGDYGAAKKEYGTAIKLDERHEPAQQNMRRVYELFTFGRSKEPFNFGKKQD
jgi:DNA-binding NtrC family response regulator